MTTQGVGAHSDLVRDLAATVDWREGLSRIIGGAAGTPAGRGDSEPYGAEHAGLIADLDAAIRPRDPVSDILDVEGGFAGLVGELGAAIDTDAGLAGIRRLGAQEEPSSSEGADEGEGPAAGESPTRFSVVEDDVVKVLQAPADKRLLLRSEFVCRALRHAQRSLDEISLVLGRSPASSLALRHDSDAFLTVLDRQQSRVAELTTVLSQALPTEAHLLPRIRIVAVEGIDDEVWSAPADQPSPSSAHAALIERIREARSAAGNPTLRQIGDRAAFSASSVARALSGKGVPTWDLVRSIGHALQVPQTTIEGEWRVLWGTARVNQEREARPTKARRGNAVTLPASINPVQELAERLRLAHMQAGRPSFRRLGASVGYSKTTISMALSGQRLPSWALVRALGRAFQTPERIVDGEWHHLWEAAVTRQVERRDLEAARTAYHAGLVQMMQQARVVAGEPSLRQISEASGRSRAAIGEALSGRTVPTWELVKAIGKALRVPDRVVEGEWRLRWQAVQERHRAAADPAETTIIEVEQEAELGSAGRDAVMQAAIPVWQAADELDRFRAGLADGSVDMSPAQHRRCQAVAKELARMLELAWTVLSDFRGADLRRIPTTIWEDLDGVRWSDGTTDVSATKWPDELRALVLAHSEPVVGAPGVHEIQFRTPVSTGR